jgi:hypothetical protein
VVSPQRVRVLSKSNSTEITSPSLQEIKTKQLKIKTKKIRMLNIYLLQK